MTSRRTIEWLRCALRIMSPVRREHGESHMAIMERGNTQSARGQPHESQTYGDLLNDPQIRRWLQRAAVALVLGIASAIYFDVRIGFTVAVLVVIADVFRAARKTSTVEAWQKAS